MNFHVMTLFPELIEGAASQSILGRAENRGIISVEAVNIRDYSTDMKHHHVDDYPYGGGAGMLMQVEPIYRCHEDLTEKIGHPARVIYLTPQGKVFDQAMAREFAEEEDLIFLCGHYEGVDERVLDMIVTDCVSIGDYVLTGGELPSLVMIDAISRMVPGVLAGDSAEIESFHDNLLEYPQYTRPEEFMGRKVPEILLSGHHANIEKWRREKRIERTLEVRPDLLEKANLSKSDLKYLRKLKEERKKEEMRNEQSEEQS